MKDKIIGAIIGICVAVTAFHVYFLYSLYKQVSVQGNTLAQIVQFINQSVQNQNSATPTTELKK